jgi:hypothetical protein
MIGSMMTSRFIKRAGATDRMLSYSVSGYFCGTDSSSALFTRIARSIMYLLKSKDADEPGAWASTAWTRRTVRD